MIKNKDFRDLSRTTWFDILGRKNPETVGYFRKNNKEKSGTIFLTACQGSTYKIRLQYRAVANGAPAIKRSVTEIFCRYIRR